MNNKEKAKIILRDLNKTYPKVPIPLNYKNPFTLLISVLLSSLKSGIGNLINCPSICGFNPSSDFFIAESINATLFKY